MGLSFLFVFILVGCGAWRDGSEQPGGKPPVVYTVADPTGDWGFPSPYAHYARGPGYVRMSFIFDTLVWKDAKGFIPALARDWQYL
ncbi:MAG: peptide/nickel transport system substrate-binding protein [Clostridia bacterium]|nr:peptide/nickel transport system substrate-binding protein [Clostridia bacterium]